MGLRRCGCKSSGSKVCNRWLLRQLTSPVGVQDQGVCWVRIRHASVPREGEQYRQQVQASSPQLPRAVSRLMQYNSVRSGNGFVQCAVPSIARGGNDPSRRLAPIPAGMNSASRRHLLRSTTALCIGPETVGAFEHALPLYHLLSWAPSMREAQN